MVSADGGVFGIGGAPFYGSIGGKHLEAPVVGMAPTPGGRGYQEVSADGGIFAFGNAGFHGSMGGHRINEPIVGMAATPSGHGYWEVAADGGIFAFGDAQFYGSMGRHLLNAHIVGMAATPSGHGYWEVASDGGIFAFGDAHFYGSTGSMQLNQPIVDMFKDPRGGGYSLVASDGGLFSFGGAHFYGSAGKMNLNRPIVGAAAIPHDGGYWLAAEDGGVFSFGDAHFYGSAPTSLAAPIVGMAEAPGNGAPSKDPRHDVAYGYDVSRYQCGALPSGPHPIGIVEVDQSSSADKNPCLGAEAAWAGSGLRLYTFLTYTTSPVNEPGCHADTACNAGYQAGIHAYEDAVSAGVDVNVPWWLDVETTGNWSPNTGENAQLVQGAIAALHKAEGVVDVGIYTSPLEWNPIVGGYQPHVPFWMANWTGSGPASCASYGFFAASNALPTGPLEIVQYDSTDVDVDYTCG
jgi:hypothetical protein